MIRKIDDLGRIGIPKEARQALKLSAGSPLSISWNSEKKQIILQKDPASCVICGTTKELIEKNDITICQNCLQTLCKNP